MIENIHNKQENIPFTYERGKCKFNGRTDNDRKVLRLEIILHWVWKIIIAVLLIYNMFLK